jgi:hypothetical protein
VKKKAQLSKQKNRDKILDLLFQTNWDGKIQQNDQKVKKGKGKKVIVLII